MGKVVYFISSLFLIIFVKARSIRETSESQNALNNLISRLGTTTNNTSDNLVFMPPTFSVDIVSLLRWAVESQTQRSGKSVQPASEQVSKTENTEHFFQKRNLDLIEFNGKSYFFNRNQKMSWFDAMTFCRAYHMNLVSVETREEDDFIIEYLTKFGFHGNFVWTSGNKIGRSTLLWSNGEQMIYENWYPGEPNHPATEHCIVFHKSKWFDVSCQNPDLFVCEE